MAAHYARRLPEAVYVVKSSMNMLKSDPSYLFRPEKKIKALLPAWQKLENRDNTPAEDSSWTTEEHCFSLNCSETKSSILTNSKRKQKQLSQRFEGNLECNKIKECKIHCRQRGKKIQQNKAASPLHVLVKLTALAFAIIFMVIKCLEGVNSKRKLK